VSSAEVTGVVVTPGLTLVVPKSPALLQEDRDAKKNNTPATTVILYFLLFIALIFTGEIKR
jgi:hypothetical protein